MFCVSGAFIVKHDWYICHVWLEPFQRFTGPTTLPKQFARGVDDSKPQCAAWRQEQLLVVDQYHFGDFVSHQLEAVLANQQLPGECRIGTNIVKTTSIRSRQGCSAHRRAGQNYVDVYPHPPRAGLRDRLYDWQAWSHNAEHSKRRT